MSLSVVPSTCPTILTNASGVCVCVCVRVCVRVCACVFACVYMHNVDLKISSEHKKVHMPVRRTNNGGGEREEGRVRPISKFTYAHSCDTLAKQKTHVEKLIF
jgi:hypothetical protein